MCVRPLPDAGGLGSAEFQTRKQLREKPEQTKGSPVLSSRHTVGGAAARAGYRRECEQL